MYLWQIQHFNGRHSHMFSELFFDHKTVVEFVRIEEIKN
jgi:hypothetical protein